MIDQQVEKIREIHWNMCNKIQATYKDGVLEITVGKSEKVQPRSIEIKVA